MQEPRVGERSRPYIKNHYDFHPLQMVVIAFMIASLAVFLYILVAYVATRNGEPMDLSNYFVVSSLALLLSGQGLRSLRFYFDKERSRPLFGHLSVIILLSLVFLALQYLGWKEVAPDHIIPPPGTLSFFYILAIAHAGMVLTVVCITLFNTVRWMLRLQDPIKRLIFYSNKYERLKLVLFGQVWSFLQVTWIFIYVTFLLTN